MTKLLKSNAKLGAASIACLCVMQVTPAFAQVEEIIVTATRREQSLQDVPVAVTAITADALVTRGVNQIGDLADGTVPGLQMTRFAGRSNTIGLVFRGIGVSDVTQGTQEVAAPLYIDGVYIPRAQGSGLDLIEPERIEVLRGPQGQLFGRNAQAGLIQFVSQKPTGEFGAKANLSYGDYDDQRYGLAVDLPAVANVAVKLSYKHSSHDGYTENNSVNNSYVEDDDFSVLRSNGARLAARWKPSDVFTADYAFDYVDSHEAQTALAWRPLFQPPAAIPAGRTPLTSSGRSYPDETAIPYFNEGFDELVRGHALALAWQVTDNIMLKSITAKRDQNTDGGSALPDALVALSSATGPVFTNAREMLDSEARSQEFQFIGSWERFDLTAGAIYFNEKIKDSRESNFNGPGLAPGALTGLPAPVVAALTPVIGPCLGTSYPFTDCATTYQSQTAETDSYGIYAQGTYTPPILNDRLDLTVGLRWSDDTKKAQRQVSTAFRKTLSLGNFLTEPLNARFSTSRWDPAGVIAYNWTDNFNTYVRWGQAYRAGGASVRSLSFRSYDAEEQQTWEVGSKSSWFANRLSANLALYRNTITGQQQSVQERPTTNPSLTDTVNIPGKLKNAGLELELVARPIDKLTLGVSWSYMFDRIGVKRLSDNPLTDVADDAVYIHPLNESKHTVSASADYATQKYAFGEFRFHVDYAYASNHWYTAGITPEATFLIPSFRYPPSISSAVNARISLAEMEIGKSNAEVALWGKNLLDDEYTAFGFTGCAGGTASCEYLQAPRTYGVEFRIEY